MKKESYLLKLKAMFIIGSIYKWILISFENRYLIITQKAVNS